MWLNFEKIKHYKMTKGKVLIAYWLDDNSNETVIETFILISENS